jgi:cytochrome c oxidase cbb3-type subunit I/II
VSSNKPESFHRRVLENKGLLFTAITTVAILIGGIVEIIPMYFVSEAATPLPGMKPYSPLELAGRDIYIREGCYNCHSQMIRPMRSETLRYGAWTRANEYAYDHPFQLGSRRIGPDIQRVGGKYPDQWHYEHMKDPRAVSPGSIMPNYPWLYDATVSAADVAASMGAMQTLGVPYTDVSESYAAAEMKRQGDEIVGRLATGGITARPGTEIIAVIAYLQRLGTDFKAPQTASR